MEQLLLWEGVLSKPRILKRETREVEVPVEVFVNRPIPPLGFIRLKKWKTMKHDSGMTVQLCPNCGKFGSSWGGGGWTDPGAEATYERGEKKGIRLSGAGDTRISYQGVPILMHWSRYGEGRCYWCECEYWHDFGGIGLDGEWKGADGWHTYYRPNLFWRTLNDRHLRVPAPKGKRKVPRAARYDVRGRRRGARHLPRAHQARTG